MPENNSATSAHDTMCLLRAATGKPPQCYQVDGYEIVHGVFSTRKVYRQPHSWSWRGGISVLALTEEAARMEYARLKSQSTDWPAAGERLARRHA